MTVDSWLVGKRQFLIVEYGGMTFRDVMKSRELEDRLIEFAAMIVGLVGVLPNTKAGNHIANQLIRSGTSPAPNYGEAQSAESRKDFVHKLKIALKELRETLVWLKIIARTRIVSSDQTHSAIKECNELIAIFVSSTKTADANANQLQKSKINIHQS